MNTIGWTLFAAPCAALAALSLAQELPAPQAAPGRTVAPVQELSDADAWRERLSVADLGAREQEFEDLVARAARSEEARATLESWAKDTEHVEFAWTCRLALREARQQGRSTGVDAFGRAHGDPFEDLRARMLDRDPFGGDPFGNFFLLDPFARGGLALPQSGALPNGSALQSSSENFELEMGSDGVKVRIKKDVDGEIKTEEYTAKSIEELLAAHPELAPRIHGGGGTFFFGTPDSLLPFQGRALAPSTEKLGVWVPERPEQGASGLRILRVQPGSLAEQLGLEPDQVLLSINGRAIGSRDDISNALRERDQGAVLQVEVKDASGNTSTKSWTPPERDGRGAGRPLDPHGFGGRKI